MKHRVTHAHDAENPDVLVVSKGERLKYERKPTGFSGWIWCTATNGKSAWAPESWVKLAGESCVFTRDYNSRELSVREGDILEVKLEESGWAWAQTSGGDCGWVPSDRIEPED
jgi:hypothetical protein